MNATFGRVVFVDHVARRSGAELAMLRTARALARWEPHVILGEDGPLVMALRESGISVEVLPMPAGSRDLKRGAVGRSLPIAPVAGALLYSLRLARRLRALDADIVHLNSLKAGLYGGVAARLARRPAVWHARDRVERDSLPAAAVGLVRLAARWLPHAVIANSTSTLASLRPPPLHRVIPSPIERRLLTLERQTVDGSLTVAMIGRLSPWKGQRVFIDAFTEAFKGDSSTRARIVGDAMFGEDTYRDELARLIDERGVSEQVTLVGFLDDVGPELAAADIVVHASTEPEPFGLVVVEGMAAGAVVVATNVGGPAEVITDAIDGFLVPPADVAALAACLKALAEAPAQRARIGAAARESARKFVPERVAQQVEALYDVMVANAPADARSGPFAYFRRPDVRQRPLVHALHRARYEIERRVAPSRLDAPHRFTLPGGVRVVAPLSDVIGRSLYVYGSYEWASMRAFENLVPRGGTVVDVGAHLGTYTLLAALAVGPHGRVVSFEPNPTVRSMLEESVALNDFTHVAILPWGLSNADGELHLEVSTTLGNSGMTRLTAAGDGERVRVRRLDDVADELGITRLDMVKLDVEGLEAEVIEGATASLRRWKPAVLFEVNTVELGPDGWSAPSIDALRRIGYRIHRLHGTTVVPISPGEDPRQYAERWHALNLVALA